MSISDFHLRAATPADAAAIAQLAATIWQVHYPPIIGQQQVDYMLHLLYSQTALREQMDAGQQFHLIEIGKQPAGYIAVSEKAPGDFFLHKFYIDSALQGQGIGKALFEAISKQYAPLRSWTLTVNRKNYKSINFYFRLGFRITEVADFDIGNGYFMEDFVMRWEHSG